MKLLGLRLDGLWALCKTRRKDRQSYKADWKLTEKIERKINKKQTNSMHEEEEKEKKKKVLGKHENGEK